jgi:hypothetical protein
LIVPWPKMAALSTCLVGEGMARDAYRAGGKTNESPHVAVGDRRCECSVVCVCWEPQLPACLFDQTRSV